MFVDVMARVRVRGCMYECVVLIRVLTMIAACVHRSVCARRQETPN